MKQKSPQVFKTKLAQSVYEARQPMTQEEFASAVRCAQPHIANIERGARKPSAVLALRLSHFTGWPVEKFISSDGEK